MPAHDADGVAVSHINGRRVQQEDFEKTDPQTLARMLNVGHDTTGAWEERELSAILRHQLDSPVQFDLGQVEDAASTLATLSAERRLTVATFRELLTAEKPPLELLELTKRFAKLGASKEAALPREVASVLYFAAIAAALLGWNRRITELDHAAIATGLQWMRDQAWVEPTLRSLAGWALQALGRS
jgi:hypothetical protein